MKNNKAFTLLELLVVIGIVGTLMALATVAYTKTQMSGRDSRRKQDLVAVQNALEQYYSTNSYTYPDGNCSLAKDILKSNWPVDPLGDSATSPYVMTCTLSDYCVCATLESGKGGNSVTDGSVVGSPGCDYQTDGTRKYYCVSSLQ